MVPQNIIMVHSMCWMYAPRLLMLCCCTMQVVHEGGLINGTLTGFEPEACHSCKHTHGPNTHSAIRMCRDALLSLFSSLNQWADSQNAWGDNTSTFPQWISDILTGIRNRRRSEWSILHILHVQRWRIAFQWGWIYINICSAHCPTIQTCFRHNVVIGKP